AGETGSAPVDEYQGANYDGKGFGSRFLVSHGVRADYALIAATTDFVLSWIACGPCYFKVVVPGRNIYTPRSFRPDDIRQHPNALVKMIRVIEKVESWARQYEASQAFESVCGRVVPKISIGAIRGGIPYRPNRTSPHCAIYVDVRIVPGEDPLRVERELQSVVDSAQVGARVEMFLTRNGVEGKKVDSLAEAVRRCYKQVTGRDPPAKAPDEVVSMWRDNNVFNAAGIPSLTFGCARKKDEAGRLYLDIEDLLAIATIYAPVAQSICGQQYVQAERLISEGFYGKGRGREDRTRGSFAGRIFRTAFAAHDGGLGIGTAGWIGAVVRPDSARACGPSDSRDRCFHDRLLDHRAQRPRHNGDHRLLPVPCPPNL